ncbi:FAD binding domain of DNA photolyase [Phytophthora infestans]|uniref:FAD binding domain of DNA photolyase n=1 Tax=Phytophthora infestans TaxID=4787 RepID=A0A833SEU9_PHYIN|nr:FAD binding domain of DNA photolyase [Phytophthora infestans]
MKVLLWFRRDLRLHDNLALNAALQHIEEAKSDVELISLYIIHRPQIMRCGANRFQFVLESVADLSGALAERGSKLVVAKGDSIQVLRRVLPAWDITHLFFDGVCEPYAVERDDRALALAKSLGVQTHVTKGYNLYDLEAVIASHSGKAPKTYQRFLKAVGAQPTPREAIPTPETLPTPTRKHSELYEQIANYWKDRKLSDEEKEDDLEERERQIDQIAGPEHDFTLPDLTYFGYETPEKHSFIYGGEQKALEMLKNYCSDQDRVALFEKPKTSPAQIPPTPSTTVLSPYMFYGCLSPRTFYHQVRSIQRGRKKVSVPPVSLIGQLLWRDFYHCHGCANPYFDKMEESSTCLQVNWRYHTIPENEEDLSDDDKLARSQFEAWRDGRTGFPWIDAIMIQLKEEGWMHHLARHSVACFLTRGDLYISWVRGLEVFQERLIDHDWSLNAGNWLWLSSSYFFTAYFRVYSPISFGKKSDPEGLFIKKYIPALKNFPAKYIYEPWKAPLTLQHAAGCRIGKDYPTPIIEHKTAMKRCVEGLKMSYANGQYGIPPTSQTSKKRQREDSDDESKQQ